MRTHSFIALLAALLATQACAQSPLSFASRAPAPATDLALAGHVAAGDIVRDPALAHTALDALALAPGEFRWLEGAPAEGRLLIVVDLATQRATVFRSGHPVAISTVSTGKAGRETPAGAYPILAKERMHRSNLYDDAPMPFMQRLTWDGVALHAGRVPGHPASHGCVRLPKAFAEQLFAITTRGDLVVVADDGSADALMRAGLQPWMALQVGELSGSAPALLANDGGVGSNSAFGAP